ncbi:MBL fold metallo-hydrolase [Actinomadura rupiterrae]|uniref:MBL fold metallo-hydrolase n=1 Tax=Actinomadura rupiterrae TaxID=559627 RepID=UPI0020A2FF9E|nr:MBL fold metallo-hydrolase [Actinomadura rupiterrae]MCP2341611.1 glyoxylase-like metal-dependent hydrolase (beta-lactamase superfamily II) [Actinomadura rupiterrae]
MREVASNVFCVGGTDVNWVLVRDGNDLTLIDGGWYGDTEAVLDSIGALGRRPEDVRAVLLTHAHIDHMGALTRLHEQYGVPVYASPREVPHAHREFLEQATPLDIVRMAWRPSGVAWSLRIVRAGALRHLALPFVRPFPNEGALDLPGRPFPVECAGHTSGHSAFLLPDAGAVATGDALITGHPVTRVLGPQLITDRFAHDPSQAAASLDALAGLDADVLVPGHGEPWNGSMKEAVSLARSQGAGG